MLQSVVNLFFPKVCSGCKGFLVENEIVLCTHCRHELPLTQFHLNPENEAFKLFYGRLPVEYVSSMLSFHKKGMVQEIIHSLKYRGHEEVGSMLGNWYADDLKSNITLKDIDIILPVPLHKKRKKERGFNQVTAFGSALSCAMLVAYDENILVRNVYAKTQSKKTFSDRTIVDNTVFDVVFNENHHNKHFLLIDDVLTTGATLEQCGRAVLKIPGAKLSIVTIAITQL